MSHKITVSNDTYDRLIKITVRGKCENIEATLIAILDIIEADD